MREGGAVSIPLERGRSVRHLVSSYAGGVPLSIERNRSATMAERVAQLLETGGHDAVFVDSWLMAQYLPDGYRGIRLLHEHNAEHVMWRRHAELETNRVRRPLVRLEARRVRRYEAASALAVRRRVRGLRTRPRHARRARHERSQDRAAPERRRPRTPRTPRARPSPEPVLLFLGHALVAAERRGPLALPRRRLPPPARTRTGARLVVAGAGAPERLVRQVHLSRGAEFAGPVDDDEALYRRARCFVDVGVGGSGTKVKVLNALARGLPVVTGPDGAEGLDVVVGRAPADRRRS